MGTTAAGYGRIVGAGYGRDGAVGTAVGGMAGVGVTKSPLAWGGDAGAKNMAKMDKINSVIIITFIFLIIFMDLPHNSLASQRNKKPCLRCLMRERRCVPVAMKHNHQWPRWSLK